MCTKNALTITNTLFRLSNKFKTMWMHSRSKQWHLLDYVIVYRRDACDVKISRIMRGAECWTNYRLVRSMLNLYIAPVQHKNPKRVQKKLKVASLKHPDVKERYQSHLEDALTAHGPLTRDPTEKWNQFKQLVTESANAVLGP